MRHDVQEEGVDVIQTGEVTLKLIEDNKKALVKRLSDTKSRLNKLNNILVREPSVLTPEVAHLTQLQGIDAHIEKIKGDKEKQYQDKSDIEYKLRHISR